jgi:two-component system, NarL family, response regulator NreC
MPIRILICDDHKLMQRGITTLLQTEPDMLIVGVASDTEEALQLAYEQRPDIVLMDISMPGAGGIEATRRLTQGVPGVRVLVLTVHEDESILREALAAGAAGYIVKRAAESELLDAIRAVARGDAYVHPAMMTALLRALAKPPHPEGVTTDSLTAREVDVLRLLAQGFTNRQIAERLSVSVRTVEGHRANITSKLGLHSRVDLVDYAEKHHLLD